jgi:hypothetical protein
MRIKSNIIRVTYAGQDILAPGQHIAADEYGFSRTFTTTAESIIDAKAQIIRAYGNAGGSFQLPVCIDCDSEPDAMAEALFRSDFVELNQTGVLSVQIEQNEDATARAWQAGVQGVECRLNYVANAVRLTVIYNFILGSEVMQI